MCEHCIALAEMMAKLALLGIEQTKAVDLIKSAATEHNMAGILAGLATAATIQLQTSKHTIALFNKILERESEESRMVGPLLEGTAGAVESLIKQTEDHTARLTLLEARLGMTHTGNVVALSGPGMKVTVGDPNPETGLVKIEIEAEVADADSVAEALGAQRPGERPAEPKLEPFGEPGDGKSYVKEPSESATRLSFSMAGRSKPKGVN